VLAAPVISASVAHKLMAFVAPKIIGKVQLVVCFSQGLCGGQKHR